MTDVGVRGATAVLHGLEVLDLYRCAALTDAAFVNLSTCCRQLRSLDVRGTKVTPVLLEQFPATAVSMVDLRDCRGVNHDAVASLPGLHRTQILSSA